MNIARAFLLLIIFLFGCGDRASPTNAANVIYGKIWDKNSLAPIHQAGVWLKSSIDLNFVKFDSSKANGDYRFENRPGDV